MTPKEKAEYIIKQHSFYAKKEDAIVCAYITVSEIIDALKGTDMAATWGDYWSKVKDEINNIQNEKKCNQTTI